MLYNPIMKGGKQMLLTPVKAIRAKCLDCCCGHPSEVRSCTAVNCPLYPYRMGKRPKATADVPESVITGNTQESPYISVAETKKESPLV